jgi:hypothetical protein
VEAPPAPSRQHVVRNNGKTIFEIYPQNKDEIFSIVILSSEYKIKNSELRVGSTLGLLKNSFILSAFLIMYDLQSHFVVFFAAVCQLAPNVVAAWRRRGFHCRSDGRKTSKFAQTFGRVTAPLAPNRSCMLHNRTKIA